jgi:hypothetical protein
VTHVPEASDPGPFQRMETLNQDFVLFSAIPWKYLGGTSNGYSYMAVDVLELFFVFWRSRIRF